MRLLTFSTNDFHMLCDDLANDDSDLAHIIQTYGYPPLWSRPNSFETLVHIILEQQVSLASAKATLEKLRTKIRDITPQNILSLSDEELKACYFSRQKTNYARGLARALIQGDLDLHALETLSNEEVRDQLTRLKGIGNWTADIYLIMVLHRADIFPFGDLAAVNALKRVKNYSKDTSHEVLVQTVDSWQPYRTIAVMLLWHFYLSLRASKQ